MWDEDDPPKGPRDFGEPFNLPNHPVVGVMWYEAVAFCRWLTEQLRGSGYRFKVRRDGQSEGLNLQLGTCTVRLSSEAEWEKAARGVHGWRYPWGDEPDPNWVNCGAPGIETTSAVGCFPSEASPYGVEDLTKNVKEWTRSLYKDYPYDPDDGREDLNSRNIRVLRGDTLYCAGRGWRYPSECSWSVGFRVVASPVCL